LTSSQNLKVDGDARGEDTILATWLLEDGYTYDENIDSVSFCDYIASAIGNDRIYLINDGWGKEQTKDLVNKIGTHQLDVQSVVIFGYSFSLTEIRELENGLSQLDDKVSLIRRY